MNEVVLAGVVALAVIWRGRPDLIVGGYLTGWVVLPHVVVENAPVGFGFHPSSLFMLAAVAVVFVLSPSKVRESFAQSFSERMGFWSAILLFLLLSMISQLWSEQPFFGLRLILEQIIAPLIAFAMVRAAAFCGYPIFAIITRTIMGLAVAESLLAIVQKVAGSSLPFESYYRFRDWYVPGIWDRYEGTLDHPLVLGLLIAIATFLLPSLRSVGLRLVLAVAYLLAAGVTQSRTALALCFVGTLILVLFSSMTRLTRLATIAIASAALVWSWAAIVSSDSIARIVGEDGGSTSDRLNAYSIFTRNVSSFWLTGGGASYSGTFASQQGSQTSLENPFLLYAVNFGVVAAVVYFGAQFAIASRGVRGQFYVQLTGLVAILSTQSFSSLETQSASAALLWITLSLIKLPTPSAVPRASLGRASPSVAPGV